MFRRFLDSQLLDASGDGDGSGGTGTPPVDQNQPPQALTLDAIIAGLSTRLPELIKPLISTELNGLDARLSKELKKLKEGQAPPPPPKGDGQQPAPSDPFKGEREKELLERLETIEKERKSERTASQEKETDAEVKSAIADFQWATEGEGKQIAYDWYRAKATRDDNGNLVIAGMPLAQYVKEHAPRSFKNFFASRDIGGSGSPGRQSASSGKVSMDKIKPGMSKEDESAVAAELLSAVSALRSTR